MGYSSDTKPIIYDSKKIISDEYTKKNTKSQWAIPAITHLFYYRYVLFDAIVKSHFYKNLVT